MMDKLYDMVRKEWMVKAMVTLITFHFSLFTSSAQDTFNQMDESGNITQRSANNFNKHNNDTTARNKEIPKGYHAWTVDRKFGDVIPSLPDTAHHLYQNTTLNTGLHKEYNTTGSNFTARESRIFIDREETDNFFFTQPYSYFITQPEDFLFVNTLSPITRVNYDNCGDKQFGEDRIDAKFAVNANKRLGFGFQLRYDYARGYYSNQSTSHFDGTLFGSYIGDRYQMHAILSTNHQKAAENGGITNDEYVTHPESFPDSYSENEIPTVLSQNWNRNDNQHLFFSHRYNLGFYRKVKMTEEELKARQFAQASKRENEQKGPSDKMMPGDRDIKGMPGGRDPKSLPVPTGRPKDAAIAGHEPKRDSLATDSLALATDSTRIRVNGVAAADSLLRAQAAEEAEDSTMKREYVPVTSFIHTLELHRYQRIYQAYDTPQDYYLDRYYSQGMRYGNDSIYDQTRHLQVKNTFGIALLEGFNKYMKAGLKGFVTHEYRRYQMPELTEGSDTTWQRSWTENTVSVGGQMSKTQGQTLHFNLKAEAWLAGADAGQLELDFNTDLNFPLFGDTVQLAASAFFHRLTPSFYQMHYHSKHLWWDDDNLSNETRTRIEGLFSYPKTSTMLRVAVENIQNYTYFGMSYAPTYDSNGAMVGRSGMTAAVMQASSNISVLTAQLHQNFRLGPLNWENVVTYQNTSDKTALPLPTWNLFSNLYLKFRIARVLDVELGADATYFSKYTAPDFCPQLNQFAIQQNADSRIELGGYPFVDVYANMMLKGVRFFVVMTNALNGSGNHLKFLTPHYPTNGSVVHLGVSWNFFN